jgi:hypothetical protein
MNADSENALPDPNGPPVKPPTMNYLSKNPAGDLGRAVGSVSLKLAGAGVATIAVFAVLAARPTPTLGAMRSQRVTWEQRQMEIAAAQQEAADAAPSAAPSAEDAATENLK